MHIPRAMLGVQQIKSTKHNTPVCSRKSCSLCPLSVGWPKEEYFLRVTAAMTIVVQAVT